LVLPISIDGKRALIIKSGSAASLGIPMLRAEMAVHGLHAIVWRVARQLTELVAEAHESVKFLVHSFRVSPKRLTGLYSLLYSRLAMAPAA
jgi:hypothetical protein